jgi:hypothetical protein
MKKAFRNMTMFTVFAIIALLGLLAYIRLAPSDPAVWHVSPVTDATWGQGSCAASITSINGGARATCLTPQDPAALLSHLYQTALATPRTTRLAGSPQSGRITWITRSRLMGYPDYTTAEATSTPNGTRLDILARQRFGKKDFGANAARLTAWLKDY